MFENKAEKQTMERIPDFVAHYGYNLKSTIMQAAIGYVQLEKSPSFVECRSHVFNRFKETFEENINYLSKK
jgi:dTDP-4-amino-4,6-dideoxygalactose transaminase